MSHDEINIKINLRHSKAQAYKDESFIRQNPNIYIERGRV
jgi:hypothetical protein